MKRFAWIFVIVATLFLFFAPHAWPVLAQGWRDSSFGAEYDAADTGGEVNAGAYVDRTTKGNMASIACMIFPFGPSSDGSGDGLCTNDMSKFQSLYQRSAVGMLTNGIAMMYANPPADLAFWVRDVGQTLGFLPKRAYAQGVGFSGLSMLLPVWKAFRNIAYLLLAIVMIVVGFMVMFRKKIDPKTVVTVQNALPKIVMTLLIITFSYAIVGLMVDIMYLLILLSVGIFQSTGLLPDVSDFALTLGYNSYQSLSTQGGIVTNMFNLFGLFGTGLGGIASPGYLAYRILGIDPLLGGLGTVVGVIGGLAIGALGTFAGAAPVGLGIAAVSALPVLFAFLISLALIFLTIRLFIFFLTNYIQILLALIFGPIQLVMEAVPGSNALSNWLRHLVVNMISFPVAAMMFMLSAVFANLATLGGRTTLWTPPYTPLWSSSLTSISALLSIGVLFAIPSIAGQIKEALKPKPFMQAGPEGIVGALSQPAMLAWQAGQFFGSRQQMKGIAKAVGAKRDTESGGAGS